MTPTSPSKLREHANVMHPIGYHQVASALLDAARQIEGLEAECRAWHLVRDSKGERVSWPPGEAATFTTLPVLAKHLAAADAARAANKATDAHAARGCKVSEPSSSGTAPS